MQYLNVFLSIEFNANELFEEWNYLKNLEKRSSIASSMLTNIQNAEGEPYLASEWVIRKIMRFTDADIQENMKYKIKEKGSMSIEEIEGGEGGESDFGGATGPGEDYFGKEEAPGGPEMGTEAQAGAQIGGQAQTPPAAQAPAQGGGQAQTPPAQTPTA